ncbi:hypothetical protein F4779DRAFT_164013 [Xylariaceae sp. FL0662B]|nr:hypothetical protein F4779DRAFT_164013 [Xylariaceae sp. FL0662B]
MLTTPTTGSQPEAAPKHRACDECRTRKLACTKESDGCSRCKREAIPCHYSPQKPMGRPRKRPRDDESNDTSTTNASASKDTLIGIPPDTSDPGLAFLGLLAEGDTGDDPLLQIDTPEVRQQDRGYPWNFGYTGDALGEVCFDPMPAEPTPSLSPLNLDPALFVSPEPSPAEQAPSLSSNSASTPESVTSPSAPAAGTTTPRCTHTANLYLALNSIQELPPAVGPAIARARAAARTAYDVVNCPACFLTPNPEPPHAYARGPTTAMIDGFQTLMLLATLIPCIAHAYERILGMVDREAECAAAEHRSVPFELHGLGGVWGIRRNINHRNNCNNNPDSDGDGGDDGDGDGGGDGASSSSPCCRPPDAFARSDMEPAMWRLVVRAMLRVDVYGLSGFGNPAPALPLHLGLRDIVAHLEARTKARHAFMDAMVRSGAWKDHGVVSGARSGSGSGSACEPPQCQRIVAIARQAIDRLVIA